MKLSHAFEIYLLAKEISVFSPNTLRNYRLTLSRFTAHLMPQEPEVGDVSLNELRHFRHCL